MRIGIDARLNAYREGGIAQYTRLLLEALVHLAPADEFVVLQHLRQRQPLLVAPKLRATKLFTPPHHRYEELLLPLELWPRRLDCLHCPDFIAPQRRPCPAVVTIHDLAFLHFPEILDDAARRYYSQVRRAVHEAEGVITVSHATRADMVELLELAPERIRVIYEAADPAFGPLPTARAEQRVINGHRLNGGQFLLFVSTIEPRKNLETLLRALRIALDRRPQAGYQLVAAGRAGWLDQPIYALVRDLRLGDAVTFLGGVAPKELHWLYAACRLYANPSLYEGFGLPVLEALACAAPTLVADNSSLPEVAGAAALVLPTRDSEAWATAIMQLWDDEAAQADLAQRGPLRAAQFSWQRAARETLAVYRECGRGGR
ncbi:glycosyltransferase family 4 protein [Candidatus Viridilinea mediisalina]|uniref:Glycosyl transferase family 1 n=1 Tax=Candidatus Viridilinea mediisalina TaxID=2024553 RepID=A0A2A6RJM4_9CHLR|nr:glycosyltransferase family 1 protein [Candidatus Viridilinea mediisalina]PDW03153.1 glycosyl transferase family 1 [Candidatus Viridilinea mediisalina]